MASSLSGLSASVTRILYLTGFPKELKTKDIQTAFSEWEGVNGGFKIKWRDDTSLLIVFNDASVAKRAYLHTIAFPPPILTSSTGLAATIKPYDGPDAQVVIQTVNSRGQGQHTSNASRSHNIRTSSISGFPNGGVHGRDRASSGSGHNVSSFRNGRDNGQISTSTSGQSIPEHPNGTPSPTLPNLPSHPTLNALINSSLADGAKAEAPADPAILATSLDHLSIAHGGPRIGDPGKRMVGAALGVRHPGLGQRTTSGGLGGDQTMQRAMGGLTVAE